MASPGGQVVGRISVKVLPDTDDFKRRLKKDLDAIEKSLRPIKIGTRLDMSGAKLDFAKELQKLNQQNRTMESRKIRFHATFNTGGMNEEITKAIRSLEAKAKSRPVKLNADITGKATVQAVLDQMQLKTVERELKNWAEGISPIEVLVRPALLTGVTSAINQRLNYMARPRTVHFIPVLNNAAAAKVAAGLAALSGARLLSRTFSNITDALKNLDKQVPIVGSLALAVMGLAGWGLTAASNLFALSASLAQIGGAALALPGIFGGIAIGLGATIAVLQDFNVRLPEVGQQLSALQDQMSNNFWAVAEGRIRLMVDTLLPQFSSGLEAVSTQLGGFFARFAGSLTTSLDGSLVGMFEDLRVSIETAAQHTDSFANIIGMLGQLGAGYLPQLAGWFGDISDRFSTFLTNAANSGALTDWVDTGVAALSELGSVLQHAGGALAGIARAASLAGGSSLSMLADTMERLHATIDSPAFQVGFANALLAAHEAMSRIATISGPAVGQFFQALSDTATTVLPLVGTAIGTLLKDLANALSQPAFTGGLETMFVGITNAIAMLGPAFGPLGAALGSLGQIIGALAQNFAPILAVFLATLAQAFVALTPIIISVIEILSGGLLAALSSLAPVIAQVVNAFVLFAAGGLIPAITTAIGALVPIVAQLAPLLAGVLVTAFQALTPILPVLAQMFAQIVAILGQFAMAVLPQIAPLLPILATAFMQILQAVMPLLPVLLNLVTAILIPLVPVIAQIATLLVTGLVTAIQLLVPAIMPLIAALTAVVNFLMPILAPAITFIADLLVSVLVGAIKGVSLVLTGFADVVQGVWGIVEGIFTGDWKQLWDGVKQVAKGIWDFLRGAFLVLMNVGILGVAKKGLSLLKGLWDNIWTAVSTATKSLWIGLQTAWKTFLSNMRAAPGAVLNHIKTLFKQAWDSISVATKFVWQTIASIFKTGISNVVSFVQSLPGKAKSAMSSLSSSLKGVATTAWNVTKAAFESGIRTAVNLVKGLPGKARDALGNLGSRLKSAGRQLIQGFINGITGMFGSVRSKLSDLTSKLTSWKGPPQRDKVLLVGAGQLIIDGLIRGMESRYDAVRRSLTSLTSDIAGVEVATPGASVRVSKGISGAVTGSLSEDGAVIKQFVYNAAPGNSLSSEEELFRAVGRSRMVSW